MLNGKLKEINAYRTTQSKLNQTEGIKDDEVSDPIGFSKNKNVRKQVALI